MKNSNEALNETTYKKYMSDIKGGAVDFLKISFTVEFRICCHWVLDSFYKNYHLRQEKQTLQILFLDTKTFL